MRFSAGFIVDDSVLGVDRLSLASLHLAQLNKDGKEIGSGTGFVVGYKGHDYLVSARHVFSNVHAETGIEACAGPPAKLRISYHSQSNALRDWVPADEPLHDGTGIPRWFKYPIPDAEESRRIDVAVLPLTVQPEGGFCSPIDIDRESLEERLPCAHPKSRRGSVGMPIARRGVLEDSGMRWVVTDLEDWTYRV
jgi:hypothetical protein